MNIEQIYTGCIAEAAYYITSNGEAFIVDPLRDIESYLERINRDGVKLKYILETHFHADFVSGHVDLANKTGATIVYGPTQMPTAFQKHVAADGEILNVGNIKIKVIHTPGHTMESSCFLLIDENNTEHGIITGDTLFIGDVGRPDLAQHVIADLTQDKLARHLYHSLRNKIMPLSDHLIVYPNHGAGSACGKNMSKETTDTLGNQKQTNYALNPQLTEDAFVEQILSGLTAPPQYFPQNVLMNINGYESLDKVISQGLQALSVDAFEVASQQKGVLVLDTRGAELFAQGFIPNSWNIGINGNFAQWVGELILDLKTPILIVTENDTQVEETIIRLSRVGYDNPIGFLKGGFESWLNAKKPIHKIKRWEPKDLSAIIEDDNYQIIDVRKASEYQSQHVIGVENIPLNQLQQNFDKITNKKLVLFCAGGYRSMIAASMLKNKGFENIADVVGGFNAIAQTNINTSNYVCPSTML